MGHESGRATLSARPTTLRSPRCRHQRIGGDAHAHRPRSRLGSLGRRGRPVPVRSAQGADVADTPGRCRHVGAIVVFFTGCAGLPQALRTGGRVADEIGAATVRVVAARFIEDPAGDRARAIDALAAVTGIAARAAMIGVALEVRAAPAARGQVGRTAAPKATPSWRGSNRLTDTAAALTAARAMRSHRMTAAGRRQTCRGRRHRQPDADSTCHPGHEPAGQSSFHSS